MAKVCFLILCDSPRLIPGIHPRILSWLRKVRIDVSPSVVHTHTGVDSCSASTIEHVKNTLEDGEVVVSFYCDFRNERSTSSAEVMRSLLSQLFRHFRDRSINPGDLPNKILEQKSEGTLLLNDLNKLCDLVSRAARRFHPEPIVVIDALDECADMEALLGALVTLNEDDVRLLVTSRSHPIIMHRFARLPSLSFETLTKELAEDITLHVRRELDSRKQLRSVDREMKIEICAILNKKADGR